MIRTIRIYFLTRALREKLLLVAFIAIGVLWWASSFSSRSGSFWREQRLTTSQLKEHAEWIKNKTMIEDAAKKTADRLVSTKTVNSNQLVTEINQMAIEAGLKDTRSGSSTTKPAGQFKLHSQEYTIRGDWEPLKTFYEALQRRAPYITMERFILSSVNNSPQHTLSLKVASVEITN